MANKPNNKTLVIVLVSLIAVFVLIKVFRSARMESTLGKGLIEKIDTAKVTLVELFPSSEKGGKIRFTKEGNEWKVEKGKVKTEAEKNAVQSLLTEIAGLKIDQLIARGKNKWKESFVDDSSGSRIKIYEGSKMKLDMIVGKFNYQPPKNREAQYYGGGGITGNTSVRFGNDENVYAVPGFLSYAVNQPFNNWRNQNFIKTNKEDITKIIFKYPADSSFVLEKKDTLWYMGDKVLYKKNVETYLDKIAWKSNSSFVDDYIASGAPFYQMIIEGKNMNPLTVSAYKTGENMFVLNSSQNPRNYFSSDRAGMISEIYPKKDELLKRKK